ncbi:hypothetical protein [Halomicrobium urmianum]|uniref:hypothetical protein n=1 Tax=Halomicrobium urmianum TaxID=1586233 RepID=UPI001CDA2F38|nr:hypothetical protein [Halomicrobium urmianum]
MNTTPNAYEQAKERARDDLDRQELANMVYDLPCVIELLVDGEDEDWRPTTITVGFEDDAGRGTEDVATIMRRAGWAFSGATFSPYNRLRFEEREGGTGPTHESVGGTDE